MATAIDIYKQLPKKNCGECGFPTCLAFAMRLASQKAELEACPYISEEAKESLGGVAPPIKLVKIRDVEVGDETVLFRHDKTFFHQTALALLLEDTDPRFDEKLKQVKELKFERLGQVLKIDMVAIGGTDSKKFAAAVEKAKDMPLILMGKPDVLEAGLKVSPGLIFPEADGFALAKEYKCPLVVSGTLEVLAERTKKANEAGVEDLVLDPKPEGRSMVEELTIVRRMALKGCKELGYPTIMMPQGPLEAALGIMKYASILILKDLEAALPLLTLRQNIYTDPQKPLQVEPKLYEIGKPGPDSPVFLTTNFSLTYFTVQGDIDSTKVPCYLMIVDTEGMSVLTGWAADKFTVEKVAKAIKETGLEKKVKHKTIVIPGLVARMSGELEEATGWKVKVGPNDSSNIPSFLKQK